MTVKSSYSKTTSAIRINWNKVTNADGYRIYRYNSYVKKWVKIKTIQSGSTTTYRDSGLMAGTTYKYCVKAFTRASDGTAIWGVRSATKVTATKPNAPKVTSFSKTTSAIRINWSKVTNADGYAVYRYNSSTKKWVKIATISSGSTTTYRDSGLKAGTTYKYCVKAYVNSSDGSQVWSKRSATKVTATKPNTVKFKSATKTKTTVTLNWKKVTCSGYKLQQYDSSTKKWKTIKVISSSSTTTYKVTGLKKGTVYKFRIQAYKKASSSVKTYSAWSATKKVTPKS